MTEMNRLIIISGVDPIGNYSFSDELYFDSKKMKDSEALHFLLCKFDPGDTYTVTFETVESNN